MLAIIYIYLNFTITLLIVKIAHFAKVRHVEMDWVLLRMPWAGLYM